MGFPCYSFWSTISNWCRGPIRRVLVERVWFDWCWVLGVMHLRVRSVLRVAVMRVPPCTSAALDRSWTTMSKASWSRHTLSTTSETTCQNKKELNTPTNLQSSSARIWMISRSKFGTALCWTTSSGACGPCLSWAKRSTWRTTFSTTTLPTQDAICTRRSWRLLKRESTDYTPLESK